MDFEQGYRLTRQAWIDGVNEFHPAPKEAYILPWENMSSWEQEAVRSLIWNVLMFQLLHDPKPSYVKHFNDLDEWQQKTDIKMFEAIESAVRQEIV